jgi:hypothetical protein
VRQEDSKLNFRVGAAEGESRLLKPVIKSCRSPYRTTYLFARGHDYLMLLGIYCALPFNSERIIFGSALA